MSHTQWQYSLQCAIVVARLLREAIVGNPWTMGESFIWQYGVSEEGQRSL